MLALKADKSLVKLVLFNGWWNGSLLFSVTTYLCVDYDTSLWGAETPKNKFYACELQKLKVCIATCLLKYYYSRSLL